MADTIDNLIIDVSVSADKAVQNLTRLQNAIRSTGNTARGAAGGLRDFARTARDAGTETQRAGTQSGRAREKIRGVGKDAENAGKAAKKGAVGLGSFWDSLKRIAFYRFVRSIIKGITDAFKTGITNMYHWSKEVQGADRTFSKSMDKIATSMLYLKNSPGAMLAPIINTLAPVIDWIIDRIVEAINWVNKFFAALSGSSTYTVAKKVATEWDEADKKVKTTAKDIKRTILGFDEINKLTKDNDSSFGSTGKASKDYNMFETRQLDGWMLKLSNFISNFKLQIPATFAALLAGFEAVKLAVSALAKLSLGWLKDMAGKVIEVGVSLVRKGWQTLTGWVTSFGKAVVNVAVAIKTKAVELWTKFATAWAALSPVLKVGIAVSVSAALLWAAYKVAWALVPDKVLQVEAAIKTTAASLWHSLQAEWNNIKSRVVMFSVAIAQTAALIWASWKKSWDNIKSRVAMFSVAIVQTALGLWKSLLEAWNKVTDKVLSVKAKISTTAQSLWNGLVKSWNTIPNKVLSVQTKISTAVSGMWDWVKKNWKVVAATALGVGIAIATPWETVAAALSSLWANVMGSFGGALAFSVIPTFGTSMGLGTATKSDVRSWAEENGGGSVQVLGDGSLRAFGGGKASGGAGRNTLDTSPIEEYVDKIKGKLSEIPASAQLNMMWFTKNLQQGEKDALNVTFSPVGENVTHSLRNGMNQTWHETTSAMNTNMSTLYNTADRVSFNGVGTGVSSDIATGVYGNTGYALGAVSGLMSSLFNRADGTSFYSIGYNVVSTLNSGVNNNTGWAQNVASNLMDAMYNMADSISFFNIGYGIVSGIKLGIDGNWNWIMGVARNLASGIYNAAKSVLGIHSPSKVFEEGIGKNIDLGIAKGIDNSTSAALASISRMGEAVAEKFSAYDLQASISAMADYGTTFAPSYETSVQSDSGMSDNTNDRAMVDILRDVRRLLVEISAKDTTVEVTTSAINKAQTRMNRRAGVTIAPVGT